MYKVLGGHFLHYFQFYIEFTFIDKFNYNISITNDLSQCNIDLLYKNEQNTTIVGNCDKIAQYFKYAMLNNTISVQWIVHAMINSESVLNAYFKTTAVTNDLQV